MKGTIDFFMPCNDIQDVAPVLEQLRASVLVRNICLLVNKPLDVIPEECTTLVVRDVTST